LDQVDDIAESVAEAFHLFADDTIHTAVFPDPDPELPADEFLEAEVAILESAVSEHDAVLHCIRCSSKDGDGRIRCTAAPWSSYDEVGRITRWPKGKPPEKQNVSIACYVHGSNCKLLRHGRNITEEELLHWLYRGKIIPGWSFLERRTCGEDHIRMTYGYPLKDKPELPKLSAAGASSG
jgi:hypothetical protein